MELVIAIIYVVEIFLLLSPVYSSKMKATCPPEMQALTSTNPRVVGGQPALPGEIPYILNLKVNGRHICGASLIEDVSSGKYFGLTAAHCFNLKLTATAGVLSTYEEGSSGQTVSMERVILHPDYDSTTQANDIAILLFSNPFEISDLVSPIHLPDDSWRGFNGCTTISGWGATGVESSSEYLQKAHVPVLSNGVCQELYPSKKIFDTNICAGYLEGGIDTCRGDSGGPLAFKSDTENVLIGITSWGFGCAEPNHPGVYTRVSSFTSWITDMLKEM